MITITKYPNHRTSKLGTYIYWHSIQSTKNGNQYDLHASDECICNLISKLNKPVNYIVDGSKIIYDKET